MLIIMIEYQRDLQQTIPVNQVKIVGVGGAGANMLDRVALDGADSGTMLALNTDSRTLNTSMAGEKVQLGKKLTMGLGAGGDPEMGLRAAQEVETDIRDALRNQKMVFLCVGLGGGTGSGSAPLVTRIAREQGAFVVVFATMPFEFEGKRRRVQAETALNELSVLSNALVTFDNAKMGELVLASQGIHEAFSAANVMISQSVKAVTRLVVQPGLINVGLDDLMTALKASKSRCLFGSGIADGENRSQLALQKALSSPLLDKGSLLRSSTSVLVHICGGTGMSLYEVELLMRELAKHVPEEAHILFGAAVDDSMGDNLSVTLLSALPEALLHSKKDTKAVVTEAPVKKKIVEEETVEEVVEEEPEVKVEKVSSAPKEEKDEGVLVPVKMEESKVDKADAVDVSNNEPHIFSAASTQHGKVVLESFSTPKVEAKVEDAVEEVEFDELAQEEVIEPVEEVQKELPVTELPPKRETSSLAVSSVAEGGAQKPQTELALDGGPKGKFSGEAPNLVDGEDLDIPPFLRNR